MQVHVNQKHQRLVLPATNEVANIFSDIQSIEKDGREYHVLKHDTVETLALRSLGFDVPAPIECHYDWGMTTPFDVQKKTCALLTLNKRAYVLNGMGTGKTKAALWAFHYLWKRGLATKAIVCAPLSTLIDTWEREIFRTVPELKFALLYGSKAKRIKWLHSDADVFIINHDGVRVIYDELFTMLGAGIISHVIVDELAVYRNPTAARTKMMYKLADKAESVWGMTGTPMPNAPTDAWAQCRIVTPRTVPKFYGRFRDATMEKDPYSQFKWIPRETALETVFGVMQPAVRYSLDDVAELPEQVLLDKEIPMSATCKAIYNEMRKTAQAQVQGGQLTAANAGAVLVKLLQISMGWVYNNDGKTLTLDNDDRIQALVDLVEAAPEKVIIFVPFKHAVAGISAALTTAGFETAVVTGDTPFGERTDIFRLFQSTDKYKPLVAHPKCMSHGLTLTAASTAIWFGPISSPETYAQANARIRRFGQNKKQLLVRIWSSKTEKKLYDHVENKETTQLNLLNMFEEATE
jgi:SNF2 family DNA or RNA helicase